ncbi:uncharacterized protein SPPG_00150 [Spizellomyces punctatus DAOM BR117]|uniref:AAA+ ATPase domain-containing protein n=1 Tax=Spizellomyces punctatus (strain DAOM BR117) TaxID=645134 RepID=A0A0L0HST2_SPIPD|nr:uncharacterized protein SPPG_00150 [Spizellomyces punctatus DAOM BR117]KND04421.1 hypothetical protein SPPG_00150 [Spizellomyces punctatus DAOM BR117]|eukprot:XP_016612460.1 hypothetical protein SPPG_00150 [Spizellomyces punctatus DAOM BR117]
MDLDVDDIDLWEAEHGDELQAFAEMESATAGLQDAQDIFQSRPHRPTNRQHSMFNADARNRIQDQQADSSRPNPFSSSPPPFSSPSVGRPLPTSSNYHTLQRKLKNASSPLQSLRPGPALYATDTQVTGFSFGESLDESSFGGMVGMPESSPAKRSTVVESGMMDLGFGDDDENGIVMREDALTGGQKKLMPRERNTSGDLGFGWGDEDSSDGEIDGLAASKSPTLTSTFGNNQLGNDSDALQTTNSISAHEENVRRALIGDIFGKRSMLGQSLESRKRPLEGQDEQLPSKRSVIDRAFGGDVPGDRDKARSALEEKRAGKRPLEARENDSSDAFWSRLREDRNDESNRVGDTCTHRRPMFAENDDGDGPLQYPDSDSDTELSSNPPSRSHLQPNNQSKALPPIVERPEGSTLPNIEHQRPNASKKSTRSSLTLIPRNYAVLPADTNRFRVATTSTGKRLYFPLKRKQPLTTAAIDTRGNKPQLLESSIYKMMEELDAQRTRAAQEESAKAYLREEYMKMGESPPDFDHEVEEVEGDKAGITVTGEGKKGKAKLWVDKYAPRMYVDLVGDERINREVLTWVKEWDYCVFKKHSKRASAKGTEKVEQIHSKDHFHRPDKKVLLLTGPPGLGKTTLAHVIARHAGYRVVEINASDDRTGDSIKQRLVGALETQSVLGSRKPCLVLIDEIDGASASGQGDQNFIKLLTEFILGETPSTKKDDATQAASGTNSKKPTKRRALIRPIICICNDPYAPVLRPLRHLAHIVNFRTPPVKTLAKRLHEICRWENLQTDLRTLTALCELTDGDIRSCLHTLQFLKRRCKILTVDALAKLDIGNKDMGKGLWVVWEEMFRVGIKKGGSVRGNMKGAAEETGRYIPRLHSIITSNGEYEKIMQGCFENYLRTKIFDTVSSTVTVTGGLPQTKIEQALDWLAFYDRIQYTAHAKHIMEVGGYLPYAIINFHRFFASAKRLRLEYPRAEVATALAKQSNQNILINLQTGMPPIARRTWNRVAVIMVELVSYLLRILSPEMRPVNIQLLKPSERQDLIRLVDVMVGLGIRFRQQKGEDGYYGFLLDPPIDVLLKSLTAGLGRSVLAAVLSAKRVLGAPYAVKQMVALEVDREILRRAEAAALERVTAKRGAQGDTEGATKEKPPKSKPPKPKTFQEYAIQPLEDRKPARDFFGRLIIIDEATNDGENTIQGQKGNVGSASKEAQMKAKVRFSYNEGFSNAVRKPVYIKDLL